MAKVFKRNLLAPVPSDATIAGAGDKRQARWTENGRKRVAAVVTTRKGDCVVVGQTPHYFGKIRLGLRSWKTKRLFTDKTASERYLGELQRQQDQRAAGVVNADVDRLSKPLKDLLVEYLASLERSNRRPKHREIVKGMTERLLALGRWQYFRDINVDSMNRVLDELGKAGKTTSYLNKYIARAKAFVGWLLPPEWPNPLAKLRRISERGVKRNRERMAATNEQLAALFSLEDLPHYRRLSYALASLNGLRRNEVQGLKWERIHLQATIPFVQLPQKMGDGLDSIPLHPYVVELLNERLAMPHAMVVHAVPDVSTLAKDWTRAGVDFLDDKRRRLDLHALRHTFQTNLDRTGCSRATKKKLMRHAAEDVTDGYAHAELAEMQAALMRLIRPDHQAQNAVMTGTTGELPTVTPSDAGNGTVIAHHGAHQMAHQMQAVHCGSQRLSAVTTATEGMMSIASADTCNFNSQRALAVDSGAVRLSALNSLDESDNLAKVGPGTQVD